MSTYLQEKDCMLEWLDISDNFIKDRGAMSLLTILDYNESAENDRGEGVNDEEEAKRDSLYGLIGKNRSLKYLDVRLNEFQ
jgi:hypothetical protein